MTDSCLICETDAISLDDWYICEMTTEVICPWCVKEAYKKGIGKDE